RVRIGRDGLGTHPILREDLIMTAVRSLILLLLIVAGGARCFALAMEDFGNASASELNYKDWPGVMPLIDNHCRVYHWWCNGNEQFFYRGDTADLNDALKKFAAITAKTHEILIVPDAGVTQTFSSKEIHFDWDLHLVGGIAAHESTLD